MGSAERNSGPGQGARAPLCLSPSAAPLVCLSLHVCLAAFHAWLDDCTVNQHGRFQRCLTYASFAQITAKQRESQSTTGEQERAGCVLCGASSPCSEAAV